MANETPNLDRRTMLKTAAVVAAAGTTAAGLAACSGATETSKSAGTAPAPSPAAGSAGGTVLGAAADIPVGGGKIFTEQKVVVTCPSAGTYKGFSAICTHKGCEVNAIKDGVIACPCHGSQFNVADGSVKTGPAAAPLPTVTVTSRDGQLVLDA
ncbi:Rieske (2Fe-2S) protein [Amycolatopsis sp. NPDC059657]|uniref:Rieske (2Fe-2S) protein n=1 Tax=Amycolatopsis sp. NPDC059657 TaxID=3346899 RepID=UPI003671217A